MNGFRSAFRDGIAGIGVNKMSIASKTTVGGYGTGGSRASATADGEAAIPPQKQEKQFDVSDDCGLDEFCAMLRAKQLEPVFKNWDGVYRSPDAFTA